MDTRERERMLLDQFMPVYHFSARYQTRVAAPAAPSYRAALHLDMRRSLLIRLLFLLRELPWRLSAGDAISPGLGYSFADMEKIGFLLLGQESSRELAFGLVGRFWVLEPEIVQMTPAEFPSFQRRGYAKVAANISVLPEGPDACRVATETRILCLGKEVIRMFGLYWTAIRPFSGLVRREWLRLIKSEAESGPLARQEL